jgi:pimeloyl-ACP methyl ester carboxylesterase
MRLHFRVQGDGPPLIILHGFLGSSENWRVVSQRLGRDFKVYSVDLRNHGRSPHSDLMSYPVMAEDVRELMAEQDLTGPFLLGHSMGGKVAMQLATLHPDSVSKLVIVDIATKAYPPAHRSILSGMRALDLSAYTSFAAIGEALGGSIPDPAVRRFLLKNLAREADGKFYWRLGLNEIIQNYDQLAGAITAEKRFTKSVCFIRAGLSGFVQDEDLPALREIFPSAEFLVIADAGHWVHIDAAEEFQRVVTTFLAAPGGS